MTSLVGQPLLRREDGRLLTGRSRFVADLQFAHQLHARFVRATIARGRVTHIDTTAAEALPGVIGVVTADDPELAAIRIVASSTQKTHVETPQPLLTRQIHYLGEAVAVVVATDRYIAADAAGLVEIDYDTEPVHIDGLAAALDPEPPVHSYAPDNVLIHRTFDTGGVDECLADAPLVVGAEFRTNRHTGAPMEGRALLADYDAGRRHLTVHASHQSPHLLRWGLAPLLGMSESAIRVVTGDVGGGFGVKVSMYPEDVTVCALARRFERPVSWVDDRSEHLQVTMHARDHHYDARAGFDTDGRLLAVDATAHINVGAYSGFPWTAGIEALMAGGLLTGPYKLDQYRCRVLGVATNTTPAGPYRGVARPATTFVMERLLERAARALSMDPAEIRRLNLVQPDEVPWRSPTRLVHDSPTYVEVFDKVLEAIDYPTFRARQAKAAAAGRVIGVGFACYNELTGLGRRASAGPGLPFRTGHESATIQAHPDGTFTLFAGVTSQGQGLETTMAQVAASELGVPIASIRMVIGDTDGAFGLGAFASRQGVIGSGAVTEVARGLRQKILRIAAHLMEAEPDWLDITDGLIHTSDAPARGVTVADVAAVALLELNRLPEGEEPGLEHTAYYDPMVGTFAAGAQAALVEVDTETGAVTVDRIVCAEDAGTMLNPMIVEGQIHGAVAQGIGGALYEHLRYDDQGQLLTSTFADYTIPSAMEIPSLEALHVSRPADNLTGVRGAGEGGTIGPPAAIANAVADALGIQIDELPVTPERVLAALAAHQPKQESN